MRIILQLCVFLLAIAGVMAADPAPNWTKPIAGKAPPEPGKLPTPAKPVSANQVNGLVPLSPATKLKADIEALKDEQLPNKEELNPDVERALLRKQMMEMLKKLGEKKALVEPALPKPKEPITPNEAIVPKALPKPKIDIPTSGRPTDTIRVAQNLFRDGDTVAALATFKSLDVSTLPRDDRAFVQYMTACCLRKMGKLNEAAVLYREVMESRDEEYLAESAQSHIALIRVAQENEAQLEQLRSRLKTK